MSEFLAPDAVRQITAYVNYAMNPTAPPIPSQAETRWLTADMKRAPGEAPQAI